MAGGGHLVMTTTPELPHADQHPVGGTDHRARRNVRAVDGRGSARSGAVVSGAHQPLWTLCVGSLAALLSGRRLRTGRCALSMVSALLGRIAASLALPQVRIPMRYSIVLALAMLLVLLFLWERNPQAPIHVSDKVYDFFSVHPVIPSRTGGFS